MRTVSDRDRVITVIDNADRFPEVMGPLFNKYTGDISNFRQLILESDSSAELLRKIRTTYYTASERMALLKLFRRCVSPVIDTEKSKKIRAVSSDTLIEYYGQTFKEIGVLRDQFKNLSSEHEFALAALIGEYDTRGQLGYELTDLFFDWFAEHFGDLYSIQGPRGAGRDIELSELFPEFDEPYPCDFIIRSKADEELLAIGFARYDSTRGGAQSDDRTGGNSNKVEKAKAFDQFTNNRLKIIFLSDGPGLSHNDTWEETCRLDGQWGDRVRVATLKLAPKRIDSIWLEN